jgi:hypothetical protein
LGLAPHQPVVGKLPATGGEPVFPPAVLNASGSKAFGAERAPFSARRPGLA